VCERTFCEDAHHYKRAGEASGVYLGVVVIADQHLVKEALVLGGTDLGERWLLAREHDVAVGGWEVLRQISQEVDLHKHTGRSAVSAREVPS
jgi:hypothetical protein